MPRRWYSERFNDNGARENTDWPAPQFGEIYIVGSSVAAGTGATGTVGTSANQGHLNRLGVLLTARGYTVFNRAVPSSSHDDQLEVLKEVLQRQPACVIFQASLGTAGLDGQPDDAGRRYACETFLDFLKNVIKLCTQAGTACVMCNVIPRGTSGAIGFSPDEYPWALYIRDQVNRLNVPVFDFWGALDDGKGGFRLTPAATTADYIHPNDAGYDVMYRCMDPTVVVLASTVGRKNYSTAIGRRAAMRVADVGGSGSFVPATIRLSGSSPTNFGRYDLLCRSFSCFFRFKLPINSTSNNKRLVCFNMSGNAILRVRTTSAGIIELVNNDGSVLVTSTRAPNLDKTDCHVGVVLDHQTAIAYLYLDSVLVGTGTIAGGANQTVQTISIGSSTDSAAPPEAHIFSDFKFYGCVKDRYQVLSIYTGDLDRGGLLVEMNGLPVVASAEVENSADSGAGIQLGTRSTSPTWTRSGTVATCTLANHGLVTGQVAVVTVSSDETAIILGNKIVTVLTSSTYTFACLNAGGASGTSTQILPVTRPEPVDTRLATEPAPDIRLTSVATNGGTTTCPDRCEVMILTPAGTIAAHTVLMPVNPYEGQPFTLAQSGAGATTALTLTPGAGHAFDTGATITTLAANARASWVFRNLTWYRTG